MPALARQGVVPGAVGAALGRITDGAPLAIAMDAITFFIGSRDAALSSFHRPSAAMLSADGRLQKSIWADVKEGATVHLASPSAAVAARHIHGHQFRTTPIGVLQPLLVKFNLAADWSARGFTFETALALLGTAFGIGGVVGGFFVSAWGGLKTPARLWRRRADDRRRCGASRVWASHPCCT